VLQCVALCCNLLVSKILGMGGGRTQKAQFVVLLGISPSTKGFRISVLLQCVVAMCCCNMLLQCGVAVWCCSVVLHCAVAVCGCSVVLQYGIAVCCCSVAL